ncbi:SGNH/GDSL hydrolase family protein [Actinokineospora auranticolor]|uniref:Lysophospholipase L1-like esterase n=1 Tax=Actinokineospora auranticolor TaxID=155976 RepID=A0A2S6H1J5_9PSEU|nr:SGNH/GDSL hydrolase family protein [Actinokineospora auranticolor]PPK71342.1 lysophospholipase L1-like esterase [Actinokineospora auranticolor]
MKRLAALVLVAAVVPAFVPGTAGAGQARGWTTATWSASPHRQSADLGPNWGVDGFDNHTVRQVVRVSAGGPALRVRLSNAYGSTPLRVGGATVARAGDGAAVRPGTVRNLAFDGKRSVVVPAGRDVVTDLAVLPVSPLEKLTVTLYLPEKTGPATGHTFAAATSYRAAGDHRSDTAAAAFGETTEAWYYLSGVETVDPAPRRDVVVAFGDSITDGAGSTMNGDNRYPDELAERLRGKRPVVNAGIGGNRVTNDSPCFGERATARFDRDALAQPGVRTVILLEGINDIGFSDFDFVCAKPNPAVTAADLIAGYRELIRKAHAKHVRVVGATLLPYKGAMYFSDRGEGVRDEVNAWIRTSGEFDAVVDFDRVTADPADRDSLLPAYDSGDHLHPSDAGYRAMAAAVDLSTL